VSPKVTRRRLTILGALSAFAAAIGLRRLWRRGEQELRVSEEKRREQRAAAWIGFLFAISTLAGIGLLIVYALGGQVQLEGALLGISLGGIGLGLGLWGKYLFGEEIVTEEREPLATEVVAATETADMIAEAEHQVTRRTFLTRLLLGAGGAFLVAMVFPLRSLGPNPGNALLVTSWRKGLKLVDENGVPVTVDRLVVNGIITVFPEGHTTAEDSQAVLVKVDPDLLQLPAGQQSWAPGGNVCYSKICTHAGCPVGLFVQQLHQLQCPCHQSAFDVLDGAQVVFGPAPRPLPQLPIEADPNGYLVALGDFTAPVGPGWWSMPTGGGT
jgi:quinol---cytochrome c reductase iron-sulfur subunit